MNDGNSLHWSFDYNTGANRPDYANELIDLIKGYETPSILGNKDVEETCYIKHIYKILPNYWRGYAGRSNPDAKLNIGAVSIERKKDNDVWNYEVNYKNDTSGENILLQFSTENTWSRTLLNGWHGKVLNSCQDEYSELNFVGKIISEDKVRIRLNDIYITLEIPDITLPLTCNWTLFDVIPLLSNQIIDNHDTIEIVLLDDLEQLRSKNKIGFLNSLQFPLHLDGFYLYGKGLLPSYWWIDQQKTTVIVSNFFETYILKEIIGDKI